MSCLWDVYFCPRGAPKLGNLEENLDGKTRFRFSHFSKEESLHQILRFFADRWKDIFRNEFDGNDGMSLRKDTVR